MKRILILGKGYIGNNLNKHLTKVSKSFHQIYFKSKEDLNYANPDILKDFLETEKINITLNTSGFTGTPNVDGCEDNKEACYHYNVTVPLYITKACNDLKILVAHIGSGCVYSGYDKIYTEDDPTDFGCDNVKASTYSRTKDTFEKLSSNMDRFIFRIRIPFNGVYEPKNYLYKLLKYNNLISKQNSITCVDDLMVFLEKFIDETGAFEHGVYNVTNNGSIDSMEVIDMLKEKGVENPNWKFVSIKESNFRVDRSNCILSTDKLKKIGYDLPDVRESMKKSVAKFCEAAKLNS